MPTILNSGGILVQTRSSALYGSAPTEEQIGKLLTDEAKLPPESVNVPQYVEQYQQAMQNRRPAPFNNYLIDDESALLALLSQHQHYLITGVSSTQAYQRAGKSEFPGIGKEFRFSLIAAQTEAEAKDLLTTYMQTQFPGFEYRIYGCYESQLKGRKVYSLKFEVDQSHVVDFATKYPASHPDFKGFPVWANESDTTTMFGIPVLRFASPAVDQNIIEEYRLHNCTIKLTTSQRLTPTQLLQQLAKYAAGHLEGGMQHWVLQLLEVCSIDRKNPTATPPRYTITLCNTAAADILRQLKHLLVTVDSIDVTFELTVGDTADTIRRDLLHYSVGTTTIPPTLAGNKSRMLQLLQLLIKKATDAANSLKLVHGLVCRFISSRGVVLTAEQLTTDNIMEVMYTTRGTPLYILDDAAIYGLSRGKNGLRILIACADPYTAVYIVLSHINELPMSFAKHPFRFNLSTYTPFGGVEQPQHPQAALALQLYAAELVVRARNASAQPHPYLDLAALAAKLQEGANTDGNRQVLKPYTNALRLWCSYKQPTPSAPPAWQPPQAATQLDDAPAMVSPQRARLDTADLLANLLDSPESAAPPGADQLQPEQQPQAPPAAGGNPAAAASPNPGPFKSHAAIKAARRSAAKDNPRALAFDEEPPAKRTTNRPPQSPTDSSQPEASDARTGEAPAQSDSTYGITGLGLNNNAAVQQRGEGAAMQE